jgi:hypothetical protein
MDNANTYDRLLFITLLRRIDRSAGVTFAQLEGVLPKEKRDAVGVDWRKFITEESLNYHAAFEKAIAKHFYDEHFHVLALEHYYDLPFHVAFAIQLNSTQPGYTSQPIDREAIHSLAEAIKRGARARAWAICESATGFTSPASAKPAAISSQINAPKSVEPLTPSGPFTRCAGCHLEIPIAVFGTHFMEVHVGDGNPPARYRAGDFSDDSQLISRKRLSSGGNRREYQESGPTSEMSFMRGLCACCGAVPVPGEYYCYGCLP